MSSAIEISPVELMALRKLVLVNGALAKTLGKAGAGRELLALVSVLVDVANRADLAKCTAQPLSQFPDLDRGGE